MILLALIILTYELLRNRYINSGTTVPQNNSIEMTAEELIEESLITRKYSEPFHEVTGYELNISRQLNRQKKPAQNDPIARVHEQSPNQVVTGRKSDRRTIGTRIMSEKMVCTKLPAGNQAKISRIEEECHSADRLVEKRKSNQLNGKIDRFGKIMKGITISNPSRVNPKEVLPRSNHRFQDQKKVFRFRNKVSNSNKALELGNVGWERSKRTPMKKK